MLKRFITYEVYSSYIDELISMIENSDIIKNVSGIFAIARGGYPIGVHLSHHFNLPLITCDLITPHKRLIVDDIADTGITLQQFQHFGVATATLFYKKRSIVKPTFYVEETDRWIVFPWERSDEIPNRE